MSDKVTRIEKIGIYVAIITASVTAIFLAQQTTILSTEFESNNRPWIGILGWEEYENNKIQIMFQNYGKIPNTSGTLQWFRTTEKVSRDVFYKMPYDPISIGVVLPGQAKVQRFPSLEEEIVANSKKGEPLYIGFLFQYDYLDGKKGEYGTLMLYQNGKFSIEDNWAK